MIDRDFDSGRPRTGREGRESDKVARDAAPPAGGPALGPHAVPPPVAKPIETDETIVAPPRTTARYEATRLLAEGGLGRVSVALDASLNRSVALKEIRSQHLGNPDARRRFLLEAQVTAQLEHPGIVPVYDLGQGTGDASPYYVMRLLSGRTLREVIAEHYTRPRPAATRRIEMTRLLAAFTDVCHAVAYAHSRGVVHRDLKPENVLVGEFGEVVVLDWGLAKVLGRPGGEGTLPPVAPTDEADSGATMAGQVMGTPAYMAPEQAGGRVDQIDTRTDVFGLGAILFEILTGHGPRQGNSTLEVLSQAAVAPPPSARLLNSSAPRALDAVCTRAMARDRESRYAGAAEVAREVQRYMADEPVLACPDNWSRRVGRWMRRNRSRTSAAAVALVAATAVAGAAAVRFGQLARSERSAREAADQMRVDSLRTSATFAGRTLAKEIDLRWRVLEAEADDNHLHGRLRASGAPGASKADTRSIQTWVEQRHARHDAAAKAASWIVLDRRGQILARSPLEQDVIGRDFAFRDYFHGLGGDLPAGTRVAPITEVHRSRVFRSTVSGHFMVAFSTPIRDSTAGAEEALGVLVMTVEVGQFDSLRLRLGAGQVVVLVETLEDKLEGRGRKGLVLHHPHLGRAGEKGPGGATRELPNYRLDPVEVAGLEQLRESRLAQQASAAHSPELDRPAGEAGLDLHHTDPVGGEYAGRWIAAREPVLVPGRSAVAADTGWVVIVQER